MKNNSVIDLFELKVKEYRENFKKDIEDKISKLKKELTKENLDRVTDKAKRKVLERLIKDNKKYLQLWVVYDEKLSLHRLMHYIGFIDGYDLFLENSGFFKAVSSGAVVPPVNVKRKEEINDSELEDILAFLETAVRNGHPHMKLVVPEGFFVFEYEFSGGLSKTTEQGGQGRRLFKAKDFKEAFEKLQREIVFSGERFLEGIRVYFNNRWWKMTLKTIGKRWEDLHKRKLEEFVLE